MAGIPENTSYKTLASAIRPGLKNIARTISSLPSKSVNVSKYSSIPASMSMARPTKTVSTSLGSVTTPYGGSTRYERFHPALDIANKIGTPIPSFVPGKVTEIATGKKQGQKGYGNYVIVTDQQGNKHRYSHLNNAYVSLGQQVGRGTIIGAMGNTGSTYSTSGGTGSHLDYRVKNLYGKYMDPTLFINI
jgi:murein DD-endopeptidase MepM/ murein hydrolase activator NlpD